MTWTCIESTTQHALLSVHPVPSWGTHRLTSLTGGHNAFAFHDVDLLPQDDLRQWYSAVPPTPLHLAWVWDNVSGKGRAYPQVRREEQASLLRRVCDC